MKYDFAVIGAGPAGYIAAKKAASAGKKVLLVEKKKLKVFVQSFSYKRRIQANGFVFDCRIIDDSLGNIRFEKEHMDANFLPTFFNEKSSMYAFIVSVCSLVDMAVNQSKTELKFYFACVGGQHRSVYVASFIAAYINEKYDVEIDLKHREADNVLA